MAFRGFSGFRAPDIGEALVRVGVETTGMREELHRAVREVKTELASATRDLGAVPPGGLPINRELDQTLHKASLLGSIGKAGIFAFGTAVVTSLGLAVKAAIDFEDAWTDVTKTVDGSATQLEKLHGQLIDLSKQIPISTTDLAGLAAQAGALGVAAGDVADFVKVASEIGASTDVSATQAIQSLGTLSTVLHVNKDDLDNFGSALVGLGDKYASSASQILSVATRVGATGASIGLNTQQILGFSNAAASLGGTAEAAGTGLDRLFSQVQKLINGTNDDGLTALAGQAGVTVDKLLALANAGDKTSVDSFKSLAANIGTTSDALKKAIKDAESWATASKTLGIDSQQFATTFAHDPAQALTQLLGALNKLPTANRQDALKQLGLGDAETSRLLLGLSGNIDLISKSLGTANEAWKDNTELTDKAAKSYETFSSQLQLLMNDINNIFTASGTAVLPILKSIVQTIRTDLPKAITALQDIWHRYLEQPIMNVWAAVQHLGEALGKILFDWGSGGAGQATSNLFEKLANFAGILANELATVVDLFAKLLDNPVVAGLGKLVVLLGAANIALKGIRGLAGGVLGAAGSLVPGFLKGGSVGPAAALTAEGRALEAAAASHEQAAAATDAAAGALTSSAGALEAAAGAITRGALNAAPDFDRYGASASADALKIRAAVFQRQLAAYGVPKDEALQIAGAIARGEDTSAFIAKYPYKGLPETFGTMGFPLSMQGTGYGAGVSKVGGSYIDEHGRYLAVGMGASERQQYFENVGNFGGNGPTGTKAFGSQDSYLMGGWRGGEFGAVALKDKDWYLTHTSEGRAIKAELDAQATTAGKSMISTAGSSLASGIRNAASAAGTAFSNVKGVFSSLSSLILPLFIADMVGNLAAAPIGDFIKQNTGMKRLAESWSKGWLQGLIDTGQTISQGSDSYVGRAPSYQVGLKPVGPARLPADSAFSYGLPDPASMPRVDTNMLRKLNVDPALLDRLDKAEPGSVEYMQAMRDLALALPGAVGDQTNIQQKVQTHAIYPENYQKLLANLGQEVPSLDDKDFASKVKAGVDAAVQAILGQVRQGVVDSLTESAHAAGFDIPGFRIAQLSDADQDHLQKLFDSAKTPAEQVIAGFSAQQQIGPLGHVITGSEAGGGIEAFQQNLANVNKDLSGFSAWLTDASKNPLFGGSAQLLSQFGGQIEAAQGSGQGRQPIIESVLGRKLTADEIADPQQLEALWGQVMDAFTRAQELTGSDQRAKIADNFTGVLQQAIEDGVPWSDLQSRYGGLIGTMLTDGVGDAKTDITNRLGNIFSSVMEDSIKNATTPQTQQAAVDMANKAFGLNLPSGSAGFKQLVSDWISSKHDELIAANSTPEARSSFEQAINSTVPQGVLSNDELQRLINNPDSVHVFADMAADAQAAAPAIDGVATALNNAATALQAFGAGGDPTQQKNALVPFGWSTGKSVAGQAVVAGTADLATDASFTQPIYDNFQAMGAKIADVIGTGIGTSNSVKAGLIQLFSGILGFVPGSPVREGPLKHPFLLEAGHKIAATMQQGISGFRMSLPSMAGAAAMVGRGGMATAPMPSGRSVGKYGAMQTAASQHAANTNIASFLSNQRTIRQDIHVDSMTVLGPHDKQSLVRQFEFMASGR